MSVFGGLYTDTITRDVFLHPVLILVAMISLSVSVVIWLSVNSRETASRTPP